MIIGTTPTYIEAGRYHILSQSVHTFFVSHDENKPGFEIGPGDSVDTTAPFWIYSEAEDTEVALDVLQI